MMNVHDDEALIGFLAGDLEPDAARRFDAHLLECEACWRAVREDRLVRTALEGMHEPAPMGLADRIRLAIEVQRGDRRHPRKRRVGIAGAALGVAIGLSAGLVSLLVSSRPTTPAAVAEVVRFAQLMPGASGGSVGQAPTPLAVGEPLMLSAGSQRIELRYYRMGTHEAVVATSPTMFPMPHDGRSVPGTAEMSWTARDGGIEMYCVNAAGGPTSVLVAAPMPISALEGLLHQLELG